MSSAQAVAGPTAWQRFYSGLQKMGRSLQLPVAVLPAAGILNRLGQPDVFGSQGLGWNNVAKVFAAAGGALLGAYIGLPLLFCVGVAIGMAKKADGSTALAAVAGFLVYRAVLDAFPTKDGLANHLPYPGQNPGVLGGILLGLLTAHLWQRYHRTRLPDWLGFFNGRRLVPIIMSGVGLLLAVVFIGLWPPIGHGLDHFSTWLTSLGWLGSGIFGVANRLLLVIGMHQLINTYVWYQYGTWHYQGQIYQGDIPRFLHHDPSAGIFTTGFFPIMMFALPAAALAMAHCAKPSRRKEVTGMMVSLGLTSMITGVTEPIEFSFAYLAPVLYGIHALLTGVSMAVTWALGVHDGFTFSAGLIDYGLNWNLATKPWLILPVGCVFALVYYGLFRFAILRFDIKTPGREEDADELEAANTRD
ncbi:PTS transporter subunit EIIC [Streptacidiphilus neutrinimicus]|uniref:PTS transporter subunit EIIC n=1 Tax=Streptacidiphilus neutrinimicus TaxID=105420 RepID=UPI0005A7053F|nr:PTS transporter subunit EIIC [Streptacidiphilus neutrinimicus]